MKITRCVLFEFSFTLLLLFWLLLLLDLLCFRLSELPKKIVKCAAEQFLFKLRKACAKFQFQAAEKIAVILFNARTKRGTEWKTERGKEREEEWEM